MNSVGRLGKALLSSYFTLLVIFLYAPLVVLLVFAFNDGNIPTLPIKSFSTKWFSIAFGDSELTSALVRSALITLINGVCATLLGTMAAVALALVALRFQETVPRRTPIQQAHHQLGRLVGGGTALAFAVALLASGASSSSVGTYAGQVVMGGFINLRIPLLLRRGLTMIPAIAVLAAGMNPTSALVLSQVVLSFGIPLALIPLVMLTCRRDVMGVHVNRPLTTVAAWGCAVVITALNVFLLYQQFFLS